MTDPGIELRARARVRNGVRLRSIVVLGSGLGFQHTVVGGGCSGAAGGAAMPSPDVMPPSITGQV